MPRAGGKGIGAWWNKASTHFTHGRFKQGTKAFIHKLGVGLGDAYRKVKEGYAVANDFYHELDEATGGLISEVAAEMGGIAKEAVLDLVPGARPMYEAYQMGKEIWDSSEAFRHKAAEIVGSLESRKRRPPRGGEVAPKRARHR